MANSLKSPKSIQSHKKALGFEKIDWRNYSKLYGPFVAGVDEVGRGCLAGDVYAAAVVFNCEHLDPNFENKLTDSKLLSEARRQELAEIIWKNHWVSIGTASVGEIDSFNILRASLLAMKRAIAGLTHVPQVCLIDGNQKVPEITVPQECLVKGDLRVSVISAASIVAKVARDQALVSQGEIYPQYGFGEHKGYGTKFHLEKIAEHGPCAIHRKTFKGVKEWISSGDLGL